MTLSATQAAAYEHDCGKTSNVAGTNQGISLGA